MAESLPPPVLTLDGVLFEGASGRVGPIRLEVAAGTDHIISLEHREDGLKLIRIIKGMASPLEGRVIKEGEDVTGWVVKDGCVALIETESFFSRIVREEISFSVLAGEAKEKLPVAPFLDEILRESRFDSLLQLPIEQLTGFERQILALIASLLMLPDLLVFMDTLDGLDERQRSRYITLVGLGKRKLGFSTLQIALKDGNIIPEDVLCEPGINKSVQLAGKDGVS